VSGLVTVVFVDKSYFKMAVPLLNCTVLEQRAVIRYFMVSRRKKSVIYRETSAKVCCPSGFFCATITGGRIQS